MKAGSAGRDTAADCVSFGLFSGSLLQVGIGFHMWHVEWDKLNSTFHKSAPVAGLAALEKKDLIYNVWQKKHMRQ